MGEKMVQGTLTAWSAPFRVLAIEVVDLLSEDEKEPEDTTDNKDIKVARGAELLTRRKELPGIEIEHGRDTNFKRESELPSDRREPPCVEAGQERAINVKQESDIKVKQESELQLDVSEEDGEGDDTDSETSLWEEHLADIFDGQPTNEFEAFTVEESQTLHQWLREVGDDRFIEETIESGRFTAKKLITAFGIRPPFFLEGEPDSKYYDLLGLGICREQAKRVKLPEYNTIDDAVALLKTSRNIIVLTGAGISTSLGIPDFRSKGTGLYSQLAHLGLQDPQEVFDLEIFRDDPSIFYSVAKDILPSTNTFSPTHAFIRLLQDKGKLLTNFTQNIDNLEVHAGILPGKLIQCHGSFATATCLECKTRVKGDVIYQDLKAGKVPHCDECIKTLRQVKTGFKRKRSSNGTSASRKKRQTYEDSTDSEDDDIAVAGVMKPDITFFGEGLPDSFQQRLMHHDRDIVDLVLVIGTSLKVAPVSEVVGVIPPKVPQIYISREPCAHVDFDIDLLGDCDTVVTELCRHSGWTLEHDMIDKGSKIDARLREGHTSRYSVNITNAANIAKASLFCDTPETT